MTSGREKQLHGRVGESDRENTTRRECNNWRRLQCTLGDEKAGIRMSECMYNVDMERQTRKENGCLRRCSLRPVCDEH